MIFLRLWLLTLLLLSSLAFLPAKTARAASIRVGVQAGHWKIDELPDPLARLRNQTGTWAAGYNEVDINLEMAQRVVALLESHGITADLLPATIPPGYAPDLFIALHCDGSVNTDLRGFKAARSQWRKPSDPTRDDRLVEIIDNVYGSMTGLPRDYNISRGMTGYYAFNSHRSIYTIPPTTPGAILEMAFLTNDQDRYLLTSRQDLLAQAISTSLLAFLQEQGYTIPDGSNQNAPSVPDNTAVLGSLLVATDVLNVRSGPGRDYDRIAQVYQNEQYQIIGRADGWYQIQLPRLGGSGWVSADYVSASLN